MGGGRAALRTASPSWPTSYSADTGSNTNGGLYTEVYQGQMVTEFNDWCFDESRQPGDTGIVYNEGGYTRAIMSYTLWALTPPTGRCRSATP